MRRIIMFTLACGMTALASPARAVDPLFEPATVKCPPRYTCYSFGEQVALSGDTLAVSAPDDADDFGNHTGVIYLFNRVAGQWLPQQRLTLGDDSPAAQGFGRALCLSGDTLVTTVSDNKGRRTVLVFERQGGQWQLATRMIPPNTSADFARSVSLDGSNLAIAALWYPVRYVRGKPRYDVPQGYVVVYSRTAAGWVRTATLAQPKHEQGFARTVTVQANRIGVVMDGAVMLFAPQGGRWRRVSRLQPATEQDWPWLGQQLVVHGDVVAVSGAPIGYDRVLPGFVDVFRRTGNKYRSFDRLIGSARYLDGFGGRLTANDRYLAIASNEFDYSGRVSLVPLQPWGEPPIELRNPAPSPHSWFGRSIDLDGERLAVAFGPDERGREGVYVYDHIGPCPRGRVSSAVEDRAVGPLSDLDAQAGADAHGFACDVIGPAEATPPTFMR